MLGGQCLRQVSIRCLFLCAPYCTHKYPFLIRMECHRTSNRPFCSLPLCAMYVFPILARQALEPTLFPHAPTLRSAVGARNKEGRCCVIGSKKLGVADAAPKLGCRSDAACWLRVRFLPPYVAESSLVLVLSELSSQKERR